MKNYIPRTVSGYRSRRNPGKTQVGVVGVSLQPVSRWVGLGWAGLEMMMMMMMMIFYYQLSPELPVCRLEKSV
ncbi:hypothetical protein VTN02DRAFT_6600 [Thermoascus thermophilus]